MMISCNQTKSTQESDEKSADFKFQLEQFADLKIMRYQVPGFEDLSLKQKQFIIFGDYHG